MAPSAWLTSLDPASAFGLEEPGIYFSRALYYFSLNIITVVLLKVIISFKYSDQVYFINSLYNYFQCLM